MAITDYFNRIFRRRKVADFSRLSGFEWYKVRDAYNSDFVLNAIDRIASETAKIEIRSVVEKPNEVNVQNDDITRLFRFGPNPIQTTADFMSSLVWIRAKYGNVFVYPQYYEIDGLYGKTKRYTAFWVLKPVSFEVGTDDSGNVFEIKFWMSDAQSYIIPYAELIHLKWRRGTNLFKGGGNDGGIIDNADLLQSVNALNSTIEGLPKAIASSLQIKGIYNAKSLMDTTRIAEQRKNFEDHILDSKMGMIVTDLAGEFTPVNMQQPVISQAVMKFMRSGINQRFGVSDSILDGDFTSSQHNSFYQTAIEEFIVEFEQEFSRKCFTAREQDIGHRVRAYYNRLLYLATNEKQEMARLATNVGLMSINDIRAMWGLPPIENGNRYIQSLNYVDTDIANNYQMNNEVDNEG